MKLRIKKVSLLLRSLPLVGLFLLTRMNIELPQVFDSFFSSSWPIFIFVFGSYIFFYILGFVFWRIRFVDSNQVTLHNIFFEIKLNIVEKNLGLTISGYRRQMMIFRYGNIYLILKIKKEDYQINERFIFQIINPAEEQQKLITKLKDETSEIFI